MHTYIYIYTEKTNTVTANKVHTVNKRPALSAVQLYIQLRVAEHLGFPISWLRSLPGEAYEDLMENLGRDSLCEELAGDMAAGESMFN